MNNRFLIEKDKNCILLLTSKDEDIVFSLKTKEWETEFFDKKFGNLEINHKILNKYPADIILDAFRSIKLQADSSKYDIVEVQLDLNFVETVPILEEIGFRLVDTRITFVTLIDKRKVEIYSTKIAELALASIDDKDEIIALTHQTLTYNPVFKSRFKNLTYFTVEQAEKYFAAWIENNITDPNSLTAVAKSGNTVIGYFMLKNAGYHQEKPIYKGILTAVVPEYRGHSLHLVMQSFLYDIIPAYQFYLDNTTQLTNYPVIRNHIQSYRSLDRINLTFYLQPFT